MGHINAIVATTVMLLTSLRLHNEWASGRVGEWAKKILFFSPILPFSHSPTRFFQRLVGFLMIFVLCISTSLAGTIKDDFNDGNFEGWKVTTPGRGTWKVENGELSGEGGNPSHDIVIGEAKWQNYSIECKMKLINIAKNEGEGYFGVALRYQDTDNGHWFLISNTGSIIAGVSIDGGLLPKKIVGFPLEINVWFKFKAEVNGDNFRVHINDDLILDYNEKGYNSGKVALFVLNSHSHFDEVVIKGAEVPDKVPQAIELKEKLAISWGKLKSGF